MNIDRCNDIVISGVGGFFPKSANLDEFRKNLLSGEDLLESRWKPGERGVTNKIGILPNINLFDTAYFGIHRQQSTFMDPMQRLVLERTFEALIDAGVNPGDVRGKRIAVYIGSSVGENDNLFYESIVSGFGVTGHSRAMLTNRVSYWLNLKGPSCSYDSNWMNGMEVLRLAFESIRDGQCEAAIIGTTNLALNSELSWLYNDMGLLSSDGFTRSFDADAQGYGRSDGVVVLYIQRAEDAKRAYASIVNVATEFNGNHEGRLLDLDVDCVTQFISDFYSKCDVNARDVDFVETYGSGQKHIDKIELEALERIYCKDRKSPLLIGSVKSNTGHSEASAALFSIAKALITLDSGVIPANIHYDKPNPEIPQLTNGSMEVVTENRPFDGTYVAVNAFGLDSYYGHALLKVNPKLKKERKDNLPRLVIASTRTEAGITELLNTIKSKPTLDTEYVKLIQDLYARPITGHLYRGYVVLDEEVKQETDFYQGSKRPVWFVYSGMGSQWIGMGRDLMQLPVFANAVQKCHDILLPKGVDLLKILTDTSDPQLFDNILNSFVGIAAVQIGLTDVLRAVGIVPDGIIGHSVGELGCAYSDGCFTAEQMILSAYSRGKASLQAELIRGMMAAVGMGYNQIKKKCPPTIEVACHNGPDSATISGPTEDMEVFVKQLQDEGIFARLVNVSNIAYHSRYIKPAAPYLLEALKQVIPDPKPRSSKWISTSVPESNWESDAALSSSAEYHTNNLLSSVLFEEGLVHIPKESVLIEIAPHGLLQAILKRSVKPGCTNVPLTHRGNKNGLSFLLSALGKLYLAGLDLNLSPLFPSVDYPVSRGTSGLAELSHWEHGETWRTGIEDKLNYLVSVKDIQVTLNSEEYRDCVGNQLDEKIILPTSSYLMTIIKILSSSIAEDINNVVFENLKFKRTLVIPKIGSVPLYAMIQKGSGEFEILSGENIVATGKITVPAANDKFLIDTSDIELTEDSVVLSANDVYSEFQHRGHKYSGPFKSIKSLSLTEDGSASVTQWNNNWTLLLEAMIQQHLFPDGERQQNILIPNSIQRIAFSLPMLPKEKQDVEVMYDYSTGIVSTPGMQICGLNSRPLPTEGSPLSYFSVEFVQFHKEYKSVENVLNNAVHIALENFNSPSLSTISVTEVVANNNETLAENIKNVAKQYKNIDFNISTVNEPKLVTVSQTDPTLIVTSDVLNPELVRVIATSSAFLLVRSDKSILSYPEIAEVARYSVGGVPYSLIRKSSDFKPTVVRVKSDTLSVRDVSRSNVSWVSELKVALANNPNTHSVFLVSSVLPQEGVLNFIDEIRSLPDFTGVRSLFILDKKAPEFNLTDPLYKNIFKLNLVLTVIENGSVGTYLPVPIKYKQVTNANYLASNVIDQKTINYIGINLLDETIVDKNQPELGNIDYSGTNSSGQRIMGLARLDPDSHKVLTDSILQWQVPERWSLEDAATVPHAYICAYLALVQKARLRPGETVLVHRGCSSIGLAAISIATVMGCTVYTTVATDAQRAFLKKQFSQMRDRNILNSENSSFEAYLLMATGSIGAHVVLNSLSGSLLHASLRCVAEFGRFVQIGKFDIEENNTIGMNVFLRNTSFYCVAFEEVFGASVEEKQELHQLFTQGIDDLVVRPLPKKIVDEQNIEKILQKLYQQSNVGAILVKVSDNIALNQFNVNKPSQFICDAKNSYLIFGGTAEHWTDIAEWLILRGARKIVVSSDSKPQQLHINRRLTLLQTYFKTDIIFAPNKAQSRESAVELLSEIYQLGPVHAVLLLPNKNSGSKVSEYKAIQYIDAALRTTAPKALLVNFVSSASGVCELRANAGFSTFNVQWEKTLDFDDVISGLDDILSFKISSVLIKNDRVLDAEQESSQAIFKKLQLLLPTSIEEFKKEVKAAPAKPELIQLPTLGPRYIRELPPLFIVPGLMNRKVVKDLANQLLYPTFYALLPNTPMSIQEMAAKLAEAFKNVYPRGPYNIVGVSLGGALAIEIAKLLEEGGKNTLVYFVDAAPNTIQSALKNIGEGVVAETNILSRMLNINVSETISKLNSLPNWDERVKYALKSYPESAGQEELLHKSLTVLRDRLETVMQYKPSEQLISGKIYLLRPTGASKYDNCGLLKYCKQTAQIHVIPGDHFSIIKNAQAAEIINEKVTIF